MTDKGWTVTMTHFDTTRHWDVRVEWLGAWLLFSLTVNPTAPACRIVLFGWSFLFGRILLPPRVQTLSSKSATIGGDYSDAAPVTK